MLDDFEIPSETIGKAYDDVAHPAASEIGKFIGRIPRAINAAFSSLDCWILKRENNIQKTKVLLEENLKDVNPDKIVHPEPYIAVPAIQAISYSMDSDELRKMYANLLSKSIYSDTKNDVHPAFVEIIKNLSPLDCKVFEYIMAKNEIGYYEIRLYSTGTDLYHIMFPYVTEIEFSTYDKIASSIDNLTRNKLISSEDFHYSDDKMYLPTRNTGLYQSIVKAFDKNSSVEELRPYQKAIKSTSFGKDFYKVCSLPLTT